MLYFISSSPPRAADGKIFTANNAEGMVQAGEIHLVDDVAHYIHKHDAAPPGWYMQNADDGEEYFLGNGASPTVSANDVVVLNPELWEEIATDEDARKLETAQSEG